MYEYVVFKHLLNTECAIMIYATYICMYNTDDDNNNDVDCVRVDTIHRHHLQ